MEAGNLIHGEVGPPRIQEHFFPFLDGNFMVNVGLLGKPLGFFSFPRVPVDFREE